MSSSNDGKGQTHPEFQIVLRYDPATHQVVVQCSTMPVALAQMILDEGARQLEMLRRAAAAAELQRNLEQQRHELALIQRLKNGR